MAYEATVTLLHLLPVIQPQELLLITQLNYFFTFDHNVFLLDASADIHRFVNKRPDTPQSVYVFNSMSDNVTGLENLKKISSKNTFLIVVPASVNFENNLKLLTQVKKVQRLKKNMKVGVFFTDYVSIENLRKLFQWFWNHKIINIFAANSLLPVGGNVEYTMNIFSFNPFGEFQVINVTGSESFNTIFVNQNINFQGHSLHMGQVKNYTYISDDKLWQAVLCVLNASFTLVEVNFSSISDTLLLEYGTIDVMRTTYSFDIDDLVNMYPMVMEALVIVVPEAVPYSEITAYLRTVTSDTIFGYSLITVTSVMLLLTLVRYIKQKKILFFQCAADVLNLLINDNGGIKYQELSRIEVFLIVPLTFVGFVVTNGILSTLKSYLTRPRMQPQINTVDQIYRSTFPILTHYKIWVKRAITVLQNLSQHVDWSVKFRVAEFEVVERQMQLYNTSISFLERLSYANFVLDVQKRLNIRGYHIPPLYIDKYVVSYPVNDDFPFIDRLNEIIHWIRNAGLYEKWCREEMDNFVENISKNRELLKSRDQTDVEKFDVPIFIVYGWLVGVIVFVLEIIWKHFKLSCVFGVRLKTKKRRTILSMRV